FQVNASFHEMLVGCSGNQFLLEAVRREAARSGPRYEPVWEALGKEPEPDPDGAPGAAAEEGGPQEVAHTTPHDEEGTPRA
ncbi:hypothetical protein FNH04_34805, partial [Streptomyces phyllanthi]